MPSDLPANWSSIRREVLVRDEGICQVGGAECSFVAVEVDHVIPRAKGGGHELGNLRAICRPCHRARAKGRSARKQLPLTRRWLG